MDYARPVASQRTQRTERGGAVPWALVWAIFALTILAAMAAGAYIYFVLMRYERVAVRHVPAESVAAVRWDVEQAVLYEPIRRHVLPVIDRRLASSSGLTSEPDGLERLQAATKINLGRDLREVVVAQGPGADDWVVAIGGMFANGGVVEGLVRLLNEPGTVWRLSADQRSATGPGGLALGQAADGVVLLASSTERLGAALGSTENGQQLGLVAGHGGGLAFVRSAGQPSVVTRMRARLLLGDPIELEVVADLAPGSDRDRVAGELGARLSSAGFRLSDHHLVQVPSALVVTDVGPDQVAVRFPWEREDIDATAREVGRLTEAAWPAPSGSQAE